MRIPGPRFLLRPAVSGLAFIFAFCAVCFAIRESLPFPSGARSAAETRISQKSSERLRRVVPGVEPDVPPDCSFPF